MSSYSAESKPRAQSAQRRDLFHVLMRWDLESASAHVPSYLLEGVRTAVRARMRKLDAASSRELLELGAGVLALAEILVPYDHHAARALRVAGECFEVIYDCEVNS